MTTTEICFTLFRSSRASSQGREPALVALSASRDDAAAEARGLERSIRMSGSGLPADLRRGGRGGKKSARVSLALWDALG